MDNARYFEVYAAHGLIHLVLPIDHPNAPGWPSAPQQHGIFSMSRERFNDMAQGQFNGFDTSARLKVMPHHWTYLGDLQNVFDKHDLMQPHEAQLRFLGMAYPTVGSADPTTYMAVHRAAQFCWIIYADCNSDETDVMMHKNAYAFMQSMAPERLKAISRRLPGLDVFFKDLAEHFARWRHVNAGTSLWLFYNSIVGGHTAPITEYQVSEHSKFSDRPLKDIKDILCQMGMHEGDALTFANSLGQAGLSTGTDLHNELIRDFREMLFNKFKQN